MTLNLLLGNFDWKGGMIALSTYNTTGGRAGQPFDLAKMAPNKTAKFGISSIRHDVKYEETTLFQGYPAKRNWYPSRRVTSMKKSCPPWVMHIHTR